MTESAGTRHDPLEPSWPNPVPLWCLGARADDLIPPGAPPTIDHWGPLAAPQLIAAAIITAVCFFGAAYLWERL